MASEGGDDDQEQRTEDPSERRLAQAFEEGDVALSREAVVLGGFIAGCLALVSLAPSIARALQTLIGESLRLAPTTPFSALPSLVAPLAFPIATVVVVVAATGIALTFAQTRAHLWEDKAAPDFERLFSPERLTHFVSKQFLQDLAFSIVKLVAVGGVLWTSLHDEFLTLPKLLQAAPGVQLAGILAPLSKVLVRLLLLFAALAGADFALTRWRYRKKHMMTREELKREVKEDEGDPLIRGARRRKHRELVRRNAVAETKRADALLVNPTHIAIALRYRKDEDAAPRVLAKGKGVLAEAMRDAARGAGIPIVQDIPLARLLYRKVKTGGQVPRETFKAVAAVLAFVYRITGKTVASRPEVRP
ncbi:MAG: EscU/YscU/HrcU family type III secretion system export apparatus switch protein [Myxococcaceae bacterium]|nr:EscU/YscU/HrcU family type III secretion system export apparatus switch protein [Myxococcaceae bacterium]MCA3014795.1 EscU/YscU/HrcU family type III secretion system export apparatus switch protein [Myxococcaceae bacterium]